MKQEKEATKKRNTIISIVVVVAILVVALGLNYYSSDSTTGQATSEDACAARGELGSDGYCSLECKCYKGEGDCDADAECHEGLQLSSWIESDVRR